jgi:hypothetical protein
MNFFPLKLESSKVYIGNLSSLQSNPIKYFQASVKGYEKEKYLSTCFVRVIFLPDGEVIFIMISLHGSVNSQFICIDSLTIYVFGVLSWIIMLASSKKFVGMYCL